MKRTHWTRVIVAAILSELGVFVALFASFGAYWLATPTMTSDFVRHGLLAGLVAVLLTFGFIFGARPEHRVMYAVSFGLRFVGGYVGGAIAQRRVAARSTTSRVRAA